MAETIEQRNARLRSQAGRAGQAAVLVLDHFSLIKAQQKSGRGNFLRPIVTEYDLTTLPAELYLGYDTTIDPDSLEASVVEEFPELDRFLTFIIRREMIRIRRKHGQPYPWSDDELLNAYRYTNIRREDDAVTIWIRENWREPHKADPDLWFAMVVARFINQPATLARIGYPVPFDSARLREVMAVSNPGGEALYRAAYMVRSESGYKGMPKIEYLIREQFTQAWNIRAQMRPTEEDTLNSYHMKLMDRLYGMGSFMAAQIVADIKHVPPLVKASDWNTFAASGPGSRKGLNAVMGIKLDMPWNEAAWRLALARLIEASAPKLKEKQIELSAQDYQNCLCEFHKYWKAFTMVGSPKQKYQPPQETRR